MPLYSKRSLTLFNVSSCTYDSDDVHCLMMPDDAATLTFHGCDFHTVAPAEELAPDKWIHVVIG